MRLAVPASSRVRLSTRPDLVTRSPPNAVMSPPAGLHPEARSRRFAWRILCARCVASSSRCRISPRVVTPRRSMRSGAPWPPMSRVLDVHADADHNRSVFTCRDGRRARRRSAAAIAVSAERIDWAGTRACIRESAPPTSCRSSGSRPAIPTRSTRLASWASASARSASRCSGTATSAAAAARPSSGPVGWRRSQPGRVGREVEPLFGPAQLHPTAGAVLRRAPAARCVQSRARHGDVDVARAIASGVRAATAVSRAAGARPAGARTAVRRSR
jgi:hypothetical protein